MTNLKETFIIANVATVDNNNSALNLNKEDMLIIFSLVLFSCNPVVSFVASYRKYIL